MTVAYAAYTANENLSVTIPANDLVPTKTQGTEILSVALAAVSATAAVTVHFSGCGFHASTDHAVVAALFVDDETYARRTALTNPPGTGYFVNLGLDYHFVPGDADEHTYKIRVGASSGTVRFNGTGAGRIFGGSAAATLLVADAGEPP